MRVLVVGTLPNAISRVDRELQAAGHEVVRCHEAGEPAFPCAALAEKQTCPLERAPVDVTVTVRDRPWSGPSPFEDGAVCALRQHIPLVAVDADINPFEPWTRREASSGDDLSAVCEEAATAPLPLHSRIASGTAGEVVELAGFDPLGTDGVVHRRRGALHVMVDVPEAAAGIHGVIAARVVTALREIDRHASGIDVEVATLA